MEGDARNFNEGMSESDLDSETLPLLSGHQIAVPSETSGQSGGALVVGGGTPTGLALPNDGNDGTFVGTVLVSNRNALNATDTGQICYSKVPSFYYTWNDRSVRSR